MLKLSNHLLDMLKFVGFVYSYSRLTDRIVHITYEIVHCLYTDEKNITYEIIHM